MQAQQVQTVPASRPALWIGALVFSLLLAAAAILLLEASLRLFWPQWAHAVRIHDGLADANISWGLRPGAHTVTRGPEFSVEYRIGPEGLRDEVRHPLNRPPGTFRVLLVGDSFTYGIGSNYTDIWPVLLERRLAERGVRAEIVNAGVPGYDTRTELVMMQKLVPKYEPDLVVMVFLPNDLFTNTPVYSAPTGEEGPEHAPPLPLQIVALTERLLFRSDTIYTRLYMLTARSRYFEEPPLPFVARQYRITEDLLGLAARYARSWNTRFLVVSLPQGFQVLVKANHFRFPKTDVEAVDRKLGAFAAREGFPWLPALDRLAAEYRRNKSDLYYRIDGHLTPAGNRAVAGWLAEHMAGLYTEVPQ